MVRLLMLVVVIGAFAVVVNILFIIYALLFASEIFKRLITGFMDHTGININPYLIVSLLILTWAFVVVFIVANEYTLFTGKVLPYVEPIIVVDDIKELIIKGMEFARKEGWL
ncbi:hypothetical protein [Persephonella sp.]